MNDDSEVHNRGIGNIFIIDSMEGWNASLFPLPSTETWFRCICYMLQPTTAKRVSNVGLMFASIPSTRHKYHDTQKHPNSSAIVTRHHTSTFWQLINNRNPPSWYALFCKLCSCCRLLRRSVPLPQSTSSWAYVCRARRSTLMPHSNPQKKSFRTWVSW